MALPMISHTAMGMTLPPDVFLNLQLGVYLLVLSVSFPGVRPAQTVYVPMLER